jgi:hypothetical protein
MAKNGWNNNKMDDGLQISKNIYFILGMSVQNQNKSSSVAKFFLRVANRRRLSDKFWA